MQCRGFPVTQEMLMGTVQQILIAQPRKNPFKNNCPGKKWFKLFRQRHPEIAIRTPEFITNASSKVSPEDIKGWYSVIDYYIEQNDLKQILEDPDRMINGDETNFLLNPKTKAVLAMRGSRNVYETERNNSKLAVTVMFSFYASGESVPPTVIYPYKSIPSTIAQSVPSTWGIAKSDKGWMTADVFRDYIRNVLNPDLEKRGVKKPVLYFVDGHSSHINLETSKMCCDLGIILIALYPNATRIMQPADVSCFKPLKNGWPKAVAKLRRNDPNAKVTLQNFAPVLLDCIRNSLTRLIIKKGFRASGLFPWDFNAIDLTKFTAISKAKDDIMLEDSTEERESDSDVQRQLTLNKFSPESIEAVEQQQEDEHNDGNAQDSAQDVDVDEQNPNETDSVDRDDSGVSGLTLKDILTTPPTPKRTGTREYKSKKFHVLTSDEFIEEFTQKEQEKKRQEEAKENRKKEREQKKIENALKKKIKSEEKAVRNKRKALSDKN
ncbi:hypothetical protein quinque_006241 [Culex quinquefasciatus]